MRKKEEIKRDIKNPVFWSGMGLELIKIENGVIYTLDLLNGNEIDFSETSSAFQITKAVCELRSVLLETPE